MCAGVPFCFCVCCGTLGMFKLRLFSYYGIRVVCVLYNVVGLFCCFSCCMFSFLFMLDCFVLYVVVWLL